MEGQICLRHACVSDVSDVFTCYFRASNELAANTRTSD